MLLGVLLSSVMLLARRYEQHQKHFQWVSTRVLRERFNAQATFECSLGTFQQHKPFYMYKALSPLHMARSTRMVRTMLGAAVCLPPLPRRRATRGRGARTLSGAGAPGLRDWVSREARPCCR